MTKTSPVAVAVPDTSTVAAIDVGRSAVKVALSTSPDPIIFPSGAGPSHLVPESFEGAHEAEPLMIDGKPWYAGIEPSSVDTPRELHSGYETTRTYRALVMEALDRIGLPVISMLVLGLPSKSFINQALKAEMREIFVGDFEIRGRVIKVLDIGICDQPIGSVVAHMAAGNDFGDGEKVIMIDIGFGTCDITSMVDQSVRRHECFSSETAMRRVTERAVDLIKDKMSFGPGRDFIDRTLRAGRLSLRMRNQEIDLKEPMETASDQVALDLVAEIRTNIGDLDQVSAILVTGGGAIFMEKPLAKAFAPLPVSGVADNVLANARGFLTMGKSKLGAAT